MADHEEYHAVYGGGNSGGYEGRIMRLKTFLTEDF